MRATHRLVLSRRVVVNLVSGKAIEGVLVRQDGPLLFIKDATMHEGEVAARIDGEAVVERSAVDFIQAL